jgi:hypothetical protein
MTVLISLAGCGPLAAQTASEKPPAAQTEASSESAKKTKAGRTWTDDTITSLRTPADTYMVNKVAEAEKAAPDAQAEGHIKASGSAADPCQPPPTKGAPQLPDKPEAVEALIAKTEQDVRRKGEALDQAAFAVRRATSDMERSALESNVEIAKTDLQASKDDLKLLQARLAQLKSKSGTASVSDDGPAKSP